MKAALAIRTVAFTVAMSVVVLAAAAGVGFFQYQRLVQRAAIGEVERAQSVQTFADQQQRLRLAVLSQTLADTPSFVAYMAQALNVEVTPGATVDVTSMRDLLEERRAAFGFDGAAILDPEDHLVAGAGLEISSNAFLSQNALVAKMHAGSTQVVGVFEDKARARLVAFTPLMSGGAVEAVLVTALGVDGKGYRELAKVSHADVALFSFDGSEPHLLASSFGDGNATALASALADPASRLKESAAAAQTMSLVLDGRHWTARAQSLDGAAGPRYLVSLSGPATEQAVQHDLAVPLLIASVVGILLVALVGFLIWIRFSRPLAQLYEVSERALRGDYDMVFRGDTSGTVGRLGALFNHLLTDLRRHRPHPGGPRRRATDRK